MIAPENQGLSVGFRLYGPLTGSDSAAELAYEKHYDGSTQRRLRVDRNRAHHRAVFTRRGKIGLSTNGIQFATKTGHRADGRFEALPGGKAVFMNPLTDFAPIDAFVARLHA